MTSKPSSLHYTMKHMEKDYPGLLEAFSQYQTDATKCFTQCAATADRNDTQVAFVHGFKLASDSQHLGALRRIAALCWEEMNHGFDLPSDVFDAAGAYYEKRKGKKK